MIKSFRHNGLKRFYESGIASRVQTAHKKRLRMLLVALDTAQEIGDMKVPGFKLHALKGQRKNEWSVAVSGNWRLTFQFKEGNVYQLHYEDYH